MAAEDETPEQAGSGPAKRLPAKKAAKQVVKAADKAAKKTPAKKSVASKPVAKKSAPRKALPGPIPAPIRGTTGTEDQTDDALRNGKATSSPERLAADIERTRPDLSVTQDAIAERGRPEQAASRGRQQVVALPPIALTGIAAALVVLFLLRRRRR